MSDIQTISSIMRIKQVSLSACFGSKYLLQDISFEVFKRDRLVIIGPSGAGKTSLLRILNRLITPTQGLVYLHNQEFNQIPVIQLRQQVILVPQEPKLLGMTVAETLAYPLVLQQLPKGEIQQRVEYFMARLHLSTDWLERNELQLSLGQRQLVAIARALVMQPQILLLDEPTSALDRGFALHLLEVLNQLANSGETTIIMVNHQLELAQQFANRIIYLRDGHLLEDAAINELDWSKLKENLLQAATQVTQEWS